MEKGLTTTYDITSMDDTNTIAKIGIINNTRPAVTIGVSVATFALNIIDKSISTLALIEFVIAVDHLYSTPPQLHSMPGNRTMGGEFGMPMGGGGISIKL